MSFLSSKPYGFEWRGFYFIVAMGLGAFLIFFVQPLISKVVLPFLGGSSSIWAVSLSFFTTFLFLGYLYAYWLSKFSLKKQIDIHLFLLVLSLVVILVNTFFASPLHLPVEWFLATDNPTWTLLFFLVVCVGVPYVFMAATAPLLQSWYVLSEQKEPYKLYAVSNLGSLLGLLILPFLLERFFPLQFNIWIWLVFFLVYLVAIYQISSRMQAVTWQPAEIHFVPRVRYMKFILWLFSALIPAAMLVALTTVITQVIAPIPLLWVVPLILYLLSFIIAFAGWRMNIFFYLLALFFIWQILSNNFFGWQGAINKIYVYTGAFFVIATCIHQYLYSLRPAKESSSVYYLAISAGGALGTLLVSIVAPLVFVDYLESVLLLCLAVLFLVTVILMHFLGESVKKIEKVLIILVCISFLGAYLKDVWVGYKEDSLRKSRNFYGVTEILDLEDRRQLNHGTTLHGEQYFEETKRLEPTLYFKHRSGVGRAVLLQRYLLSRRGLRIGVVGLGTGTMGAYCRPQDEMDFYEIDKRMVAIAENSFSYLEKCRYKIYLGDGRISLKNNPMPNEGDKYDVLAIDAFSDDSVPVHLITKEAVEIFMSKIKQRGILAIHTSNRYLDLEKVVLRIAKELNIPAVAIGGKDGENEYLGSVWVLLSHDVKILTDEKIGGELAEVDSEVPLWTDSYVNIFPVMYQKLF